MKDISEILKHSPILPLLSFKNTEEAITVCRALYEEGVKVMEIAMNHKSALDAIIAVKGNLPEDVYIGAGSIVNPDMAETAIAIGSSFGVSPGITSELGKAIRSLRWPFLPAASTVSEAMRINELGFKNLKFVPLPGSNCMEGMNMIAQVMPNLTICPAVPSSNDDVIQYLNHPNVSSVSTTWLTPRDEQGLYNTDLIRSRVRGIYSRVHQPEAQTV